MGLFGAKRKREVEDPQTGEKIYIKEDMKCETCGKDLTVFNKNKVINDFFICDECGEKSAIFRHKNEVTGLSPDAVKNVICEKIKKYDEFNITNRIEDYIFIDMDSKKWTIPYQSGVISQAVKVDPAEIYDLDIIKEYKLFEDDTVLLKGGSLLPVANENVFTEMKILPGEIKNGIATHCMRLSIQIETHLENVKYISVELINKKTERNSDFYKAQLVGGMQIITMLDRVFHKEETDRLLSLA